MSLTNSKILFVLKKREDYCEEIHHSISLSTGLYHSANFIREMLNDSYYDIESKIIVVDDNNDIDKAVSEYNPTHVIIEALWVVPEKFQVLQKLHPNVQWIIRLHSEMPFVSNEGIAIDWIAKYSSYKNVVIACNSIKMLHEIRAVIRRKQFAFCSTKSMFVESKLKKIVIYLPNYYPQKYSPAKRIDKSKRFVDIGCFGAIRPMKNHLIQAHAAIEFAESIDKTLRFHINVGRVEMQGQSILKNVKALFEHSASTNLVIHDWTTNRDEFLNLCSQMDIGMQCSFSETFNIVGADFINEGVPLVSSYEIPWASRGFSAAPTNSKDIIRSLRMSYEWPRLNVWHNRGGLTQYTNESAEVWYNYFGLSRLES